MPIIGLQSKLQERGRIRIGEQVEARGKKFPRALAHFRLTSRDKTAIEDAAKAFGGKVEPWDNNGRKEWQVKTEADSLPVLIPPTDFGFTQWNELWSAGGCLRRCSGDPNSAVAEQINEGPCICALEGGEQQCEPHTRLSVMLHDVPGFGLWRLDTQGINAAMEMSGAFNTLRLLSVNGQIVRGVLRLDQRSIKRVDEGVKRFVVPMIDFDVAPLLEAVAAGKPALTPVPDKGKPPNIAEQMKAVESLESSRKRAAEIKPTGIEPRTAVEAARQRSEPVVVKITGEFKHNEPAPDPAAVAANDVAADDDPEQGSGYEPPVETGKQLIQQRQLGVLGQLFNEIGMPPGDKPRLDWCIKQLGRTVSSPAEFTEAEAVTLADKLTKLRAIRLNYQTDDYDVILVDLTEYLQRDTKLRSLDDMTDDEIASCLEAIEMAASTGRQILGLNIGGHDETTTETENG